MRLGRGGDHAEWIGRELQPGATWLFCGPVGSGRSTALASVQLQLQRRGWRVIRPEDLPTTAPGSAEPRVLLVDDADRLSSAAAEACAACLSGDEAVAVVAASRSEGLMTAYHPLAARLRDAEMAVVLAETRPAHLPTVDLRGLQDPIPPPGRGVLIDPRQTVPLQLARVHPVPTAAATPQAELSQNAVGPTPGAGGGQ